MGGVSIRGLIGGRARRPHVSVNELCRSAAAAADLDDPDVMDGRGDISSMAHRQIGLYGTGASVDAKAD